MAQLLAEFARGEPGVRTHVHLYMGSRLVEAAGRGTFVREAPAQQVIDLDSGAVVRTRVPTPQERRQLGITKGVPVLVVGHVGKTALYAADRCVLRAGAAR